MKKVGVFVDRWMSGGIESYLVSNYESMDLNDLDIKIITTRKFSDMYDERLNILGIEIIELLKKGKDSELTRTFKSQAAFKKVMSDEKFDILHLNIYNGFSLLYSKIAYNQGVERIIAHSHNSMIGQVRLKLLKLAVHSMSKIRYQKYVTDFWACSDLAGKWLFSSDEEKHVRLMKNGIKTEKFSYDTEKRRRFREMYSIKEDTLVLGNIGRLNNQKNQMFLIDIAEALRDSDILFKMIIVGEGELREKLERKIKELRLEKYVVLAGTTTDTPGFYSGIDLFLLPSLFEGNPIVGIEAQCSGVKCLFSDKITKQVMIIDSSEFLPVDSPEAWIKAIIENEGKHALRDNMHQAAIDRQFDIIDTSREMHQLFLSL